MGRGWTSLEGEGVAWTEDDEQEQGGNDNARNEEKQGLTGAAGLGAVLHGELDA